MSVHNVEKAYAKLEELRGVRINIKYVHEADGRWYYMTAFDDNDDDKIRELWHRNGVEFLICGSSDYGWVQNNLPPTLEEGGIRFECIEAAFAYLSMVGAV